MSHIRLFWVAIPIVDTSRSPIDDRLCGEVVEAVAQVDVVVPQVADVQRFVVVNETRPEIGAAQAAQRAEDTTVQVAVVATRYVRHQWGVVIVQPTAGPVLDRSSLQLGHVDGRGGRGREGHTMYY